MNDKPQMKTYTLCNGEVVSIWGCSGEWYSVDEVDARIAELEKELKVLQESYDVLQAFYKLVVKERDYARTVQALKGE